MTFSMTETYYSRKKNQECGVQENNPCSPTSHSQLSYKLQLFRPFSVEVCFHLLRGAGGGWRGSTGRCLWCKRGELLTFPYWPPMADGMICFLHIYFQGSFSSDFSFIVYHPGLWNTWLEEKRASTRRLSVGEPGAAYNTLESFEMSPVSS